METRWLVLILTTNRIHELELSYRSVINQNKVNGVLRVDVVVVVNSLDLQYHKQVDAWSKDKNVKIYHSDDCNGHPGKGHNECLRYYGRCKTQYKHMIMIDGDDILYPHCFRFLYELNHIDLGFFMMNDKLTLYNDSSHRIKSYDGSLNFESTDVETNLWKVDPPICPIGKNLLEGKTPIRLFFWGENMFHANGEPKLLYSEDLYLYDDYPAFVRLLYLVKKEEIKTALLNNSNLYAYNTINEKSATRTFDINFLWKENMIFQQNLVDELGEERLYEMQQNWSSFLSKFKFYKLKKSIIEKYNIEKELTTSFRFSYYMEHLYVPIFQQMLKTWLERDMNHANVASHGIYRHVKEGKRLLQLGTPMYMDEKKAAFIHRRLLYWSWNTNLYNETHYFIRNYKFFEKKKIPSSLTIGIYTGFSPSFDSDEMNNVYGSETSAYYLAREFVKMNYKVYLYCNNRYKVNGKKISTRRYIKEGIEWCYLSELENDIGRISYNLFIGSRFIHLFEKFPISRIKNLVHWNHDLFPHYMTGKILPLSKKITYDKRQIKIAQTPFEEMEYIPNSGFPFMNNLYGKKVNRIVYPSTWLLEAHTRKTENSRLIPFQFSNEVMEKMVVIPNGIPSEIFTVREERNPNRVIWCIDPARGLDLLLSVWPQLKEIEPNLVLDIYFHSLDTSFQEKIKNRTDIRFHGFIPNQLIFREMAKSQYFIYPMVQHETFSITTLQAFALGCMVITSFYTGPGELSNTFIGFTFPYKNDKNVSYLVQLFKRAHSISSEDAEKIRTTNMETSRQYDWSNIAQRWIDLCVENPQN